ncbi:MAG: 3-phosphoglycerate dehydrogenase [Bacteroidetes bacterium RIFCSPLOWO2_12_FULL_37_12]|nr:MAG: 3-phosphoglycerate dehydrogenase [Bacteroidetes bacterium RIFCSPLOWO2_12_FULL_37_12]
MNILINDGIDKEAKSMLEKAGFTLDMNKIPQQELAGKIQNYSAILVRSATKVKKTEIDAGVNLKLIGRGGVGLDNIDVEYARAKGIAVINTPDASTLSVAELVIAHTFGMARFLHQSNREMPAVGINKFEELKKKYSAGKELRGKTMGIIGFGRIGQETARIAFRLGMKVILHNRTDREFSLKVDFAQNDVNINLEFKVKATTFEHVLENSDFISIHVPFKKGDKPIISSKEFEMMKPGTGLINCSRGGVVDEKALLSALNTNKIAYAAVDVYESEPTDNLELLSHSAVSLTPHTGASTVEAQQRVGTQLASQVIDFFRGKGLI